MAWLAKEAPREKPCRIEAVRKTDATLLDLSNLKLIALPEAIGQLTALTKLWLLIDTRLKMPGGEHRHGRQHA